MVIYFFLYNFSMNKARKQGLKINISKMRKGSKELTNLHKDKLFCFDEECNTPLILCSFKENNIPTPYFKTRQGYTHIKKCIETVDGCLEWDGKLIPKRNGKVAFNKMLSKFTSPQNPISYTIYQSSKKNSVSSVYNNRRSHIRKSKVGHVTCEYNTIVQEKITYLLKKDKKIKINKQKEHIYINLKDIGIGFPKNSRIYSDKVNDIFFFSKRIAEKNKRKYTLDFDYFIINHEEIIIEKRINKKITHYN